MCLNIICNRSFFILKWCQPCSGLSFIQGWKDIGAKTYLFTDAQTAIYDSKVKLFLKQGISHQLGRGWTQLFDLNVRIQQLMWSLIFYEKYSTSQSYLWFWPSLIFFLGGGFSNFYRYYTRSQTGKSTGPLWNPCIYHIIYQNDWLIGV